jgi:hypothetical protein
MQYKICLKCNREKDVSDFHKNKRTKDGYDRYCKQCKYEAYLVRYEKNKDKIKEYNKNYRLNHIEENKINKHNYDIKNKNKHQEYGRLYRQTHKEQIKNKNEKYKDRRKEVYKEWFEKNRLNGLLYGIRDRAKNNNILCDSLNDLRNYLQPIYDIGECQKCHCKLEHGIKKNKNNSPSIDRIIPEKGYTVGNITVLCACCNRKKQDNNLEDFKNWVKWMEEMIR